MKLIPTILYLTIAFVLTKAYSQIITLPDEFTDPAVITDIEDLIDPDTSATLIIDLREHFELSNVKGQVVQFNSNLGIINLELFDANTLYNKPVTVANFLDLVNGGDFDNSIIHRSPPAFVIQGGGFINTQGTGESPLDDFREVDPIINEPGISNTAGTIAMAKLGGDADSATSQWFINMVNNSANLDNQNGGFTVFGRIIGNSAITVNAIENLIDFPFASPFDSLPLTGYTVDDFNNSVGVSPENFVTFATVSTIDIYPAEENLTAVLSFQLTNTNENLLTATIVGSELRLDFSSGQTGEAEILVTALDTHNLSAEISFLVTVAGSGQSDVFGGTDIPDFSGWMASSWYFNYNIDFWPWIYHDEHGWQYVSENSSEEVIFIFDPGLQEWIFLNESTYRWIFIFGGDNAGWVWTFGDNTPNRRFFQRLDGGSLFSVPPDLPVD